MSAALTPTLEQLMADVAALLNKESVDPDVSMVELGMDSMNVVELIMICEQIYTNVTDPSALEFDQYTTLRDMDNKLLECSA